MSTSDHSAESEQLLAMRREVERLTEAYIARLLQSKEALSEHLDFLRTILDCIGDGLIVYDCTGKVVLANKAACRLAGFELAHSDKSEIAKKCSFFAYKGGPQLRSYEEPFAVAMK